ncbi:MAG: T9SS type A sorting domain-containing protein [Rhodothermales bacterium]
MTRISRRTSMGALALLLLTASAVLPAQAQQATLALSEATVSPEQTFALSLTTSDLTGLNVTAYNVVLTYDTAKLTAQSVSLDGTLSGPDAAGMTLVYNNDTPGTLSIVAAGVKAIVGAGTLAHVHFKAGATSGTAAVAFGSIMLNEGDPVATGATVNVTIRPILFGDASQNGEVTAFDAAQILQHASEINVLSGAGLEAADVSANGSVSAYDAALVLQHVAGAVTCFPAANDCVAKQGGETPELALRWGRPYVRDGETRVDLIAATANRAVRALELDVHFAGAVLRGVDERSGRGWAAAYRASEADLALSLASPGTLAADTLLTLRFAGQPDLAAAEARLQLNEQAMARVAIDVTDTQPATFHLSQNYPNPFNPSTRIQFALNDAAPVRLAVYDLLGREVRTLVDATRAAGTHTVTFDAGDLPSGVYFYRIEAGAASETRRMVLMK